MKWRERKRRHDDAHFPLQGRGKRARRAAKVLSVDQRPVARESATIRSFTIGPTSLLGYWRAKLPIYRAILGRSATETQVRHAAFEAVEEEWLSHGDDLERTFAFNRELHATMTQEPQPGDHADDRR